MKRYKLKITYFILLLLSLFASCTDEEIFQGSGVTEGVPTTVDISVGTAANTAKTRSVLLESEERKIYNLYLWVFNSSGNVEYSREYSRADLIQAATDLTTSTGEVDADAPTSMGLLKNISLTTGKKTLFLLGNYKSDADGLFHVEPEVLNGISKYSDLEKVRAAMTVHTLFRPNGNLLMSLTQTVTVSTATKQIEVSLKRSEAKITLNLQTIAGLTFEPGTYRLGNVPGSTFIVEHAKGADQTASWDADGVDKKLYWVSEYFQFEGDADNVTTSFYMPENRKVAKKAISPASPGYSAERKGYDLRQKQLKSPVAGATDKPNLQNGETEYAPDLAPYIEFTGELRQNLATGDTSTERFGRVTYRIYLGYTAENDPVNDYDIERNVHYTYNVTIKGMNDLVVEAKSDKAKEEESAPGVEGLVYDAHRSFNFDCHYEQGLMRFKKDELAIFNPDGTLKDDAMISFAIRTPFCDKIISYTKAELEQLKNNNYIPSKEKKADTDWLKFYIHPSTLADNGNEDMQYFSDTGANLLSLEQFLYRLMNEPDYVFNAASGLCKVTVYANEFFYEQNPMQENAPKDKNLWKTFANSPDRTFDLLVNTSHEISPDGQSRYHQAIVTIRQMSIKTVFVNSPDGMRVWGVENVNETPDLDWSVRAPSEPDAFYNKYYSNGWANTWSLMSRRTGGLTDNIMPDPMLRGKEKTLWQVMTKVNNAKLTLSMDHTNLAMKNYHATYACFTPFLRNRDNNRDGQMQANEMQWYIPSVCETNMLYVAERVLPLKSRLVGHAPSDNATALFTSRAFMGSTNLTLNSPNTIIFVEESHSMTPIYNFDYQKTASPGERTPFSDVRLIRDLGILETSEDHSYHLDEIAKELSKTLINKWTEDEYLIFRADNLPSNTTRSARAIYELPAHNETSQINTIYQKGFEVAKYIANRIDKRKDLDNPNRSGEYYYETWTTLMNDIEKGNSPCTYYFQNPDQSDLGTWRLPNEAELMIMAGSLFDWDDRERPKVYDFGGNLSSLNMKDGQVIHSRTGFSRRDMNGGRSFSAGYQMYFDGYLRFVTTVDTQWGGDKNRLVNDRNGYVRCVRDLK
ncbi:fimbrial protein [Bacteroides hominis]|uniref:fimbrial protein n=1 Tax=Bacteroides hominis TaxID=2763023 RepID=UPI00228D9E6E|nr:fimbrial protein [Bacteroides hominis (ex Liu et al. 2022)]MCY6344279.1 fimbrial protein [Bacteroides fragilis]MDV6205019.1 fimbrial protein [Bacteroides hominis (ex Liu et al. 2022)]